MQSLAEIQQKMVTAMVSGDATAAPAGLYASGATADRVAIHLRHFESSLIKVLRDKYPATAWLIGGDSFISAAREFIRRHPPEKPCLTEYGSDFGTWLATTSNARREESKDLDSLESFVRLEWLLGQASIATDKQALTWTCIATIGADKLIDTRLELQPGLYYLRASHNIDELMSLFLNEQRPSSFRILEQQVYLEVRGSRGSYSIGRISEAKWRLLNDLQAGRSIGQAAGAALEADPSFDLAAELRSIVSSGRIATINS